jgi:Bacterial mobilisation protein (MobC)
MAATDLIAARVSPETKALFRTLAERQQMTESALLKRMVDLAVRSVDQSDAQVLRPTHRQLRGSRLCVRLNPDDQLLLGERATSRQMAAATYVAVLVRAHLRALAPLPKAELMALKRSVAELGAIGRNINQLARLAHEGARPTGPSREELRLIIKVCEAMRDHIKDLIEANTGSWESGHANIPS